MSAITSTERLQRLLALVPYVVSRKVVGLAETAAAFGVSERELVDDLRLAAVIVTHDLAVARLLAHRMLVMKDGRVVEQGLTDRVLDDPQHPYTQLLVSSVLAP